MDDDDDDDLIEQANNNEVTFPVANTGYGEHTATMRILREVDSLDLLRETLKGVALSTSPHVTVEVVFGSTVPPPLLVTVEQAANSLATTPAHVEQLIEYGWLTEISRRLNHRRPGRWSGWQTRILWSELVELVDWAREHQELPFYQAPEPKVNNTPKVKNERYGEISTVTRKVLRDHGDWILLGDLHRLVDEQIDWCEVSYKTVQAAMGPCVRSGVVERRDAPRERGVRVHVGHEYRWVEGVPEPKPGPKGPRGPNKKPLDW